MKELRSEVDIHASAEQVWQLLTDFAGFAEWNPFIRRVSGAPTVGERLEVYMQSSNAAGTTTHPVVLKSEPNRELRWRRSLSIPGCFDGEHIFTIEPLETGRVRFTQREIVTGFLVPFRARQHDAEMRRGLKEMNQALKQRAEQLTPVAEHLLSREHNG